MPIPQEQIFGGGCCLTIIIVSVILFACSFDVLEPRWYGLIYDDAFKTVPQNDIRREADGDGGRQMLGLGRKFIPYPRGYVTMEWTSSGKSIDGPLMDCWTAQGQNVYLDISLQLTVKKEALPILYYQWGTHYRDHLRVSIQRTIKDETTKFSSLQFFENRKLISSRLEDAIKVFLAIDDFFEMKYFQLRNVDLPADFENAILQKILYLQEQRTAKFMKQVVVIKELVKKEALTADADVNVVLTNATMIGDYSVTVQEAEGRKRLLNAYATQFNEFAIRLGWIDDGSNPRLKEELGEKALNFYIWSRLARNSRSGTARQVVGFSGAKMNI